MNQSPAEVLAGNLVLTATQVAYVLGLVHTRGARKGQPDPRRALELIKAGRLQLIDPTQPITRWTVSVNQVRKYIDGSAAAS